MSALDPTTDTHIHPASLSTSSAADGTPTLSVNADSSAVHPASTTASKFSATNLEPITTGLRQRVNKLSTQVDQATNHPAVKNAKTAAWKQIAGLSDMLGKNQIVLDLEKRTGIDRVLLVVGGAFLYLLLIPLNLFGLALPVTTLLTLLPPAYLAVGLLELGPSAANDEATKSLLAYFVVLGFIQFLESLAAGVLARRIPQYYTLKLVFLAYLLHPRTKGAMVIHTKVLKPLMANTAQVVGSTSTPPTSKSSMSPSSSPSGAGVGATGTHIPLAGDEAGNLTKGDAAGEGFNVVTEAY